MTFARPDPVHDASSIPPLPGWVTAVRPELPEDVAFLSGAALAHLHFLFGHDDVPHALLRDRLALWAGEACVSFSGRPERAAALRDEVHLLRPGDQPGPAGEVYLCWRRAVARLISAGMLRNALPEAMADKAGAWLRPGQGVPVAQASAMLETVLADHPREESAALILADAVLAQSLGWDHVTPLLAAGLKPRDLRKTGDDLRLACHRALVTSAVEAVRLAVDLTRRAARLRVVAPKLRARGARAAVEMFLTRDAVAPAALTGVMSDRAARRLCDRLVELGAVRELSGRDTFRLYGV